MLSAATSVVVVPGYGMAVAQAQHRVREIYDQLSRRGIDVKFAIHPVAGRMPGHMNVLLAEADIPYDRLVEMDEINKDMPQVDVVLVVGANDVVNPAARSDPNSPIYGMPSSTPTGQALHRHKRTMNPGFAGIDNDLYYTPTAPSSLRRRQGRPRARRRRAQVRQLSRSRGRGAQPTTAPSSPPSLPTARRRRGASARGPPPIPCR